MSSSPTSSTKPAVSLLKKTLAIKSWKSQEINTDSKAQKNIWVKLSIHIKTTMDLFNSAQSYSCLVPLLNVLCCIWGCPWRVFRRFSWCKMQQMRHYWVFLEGHTLHICSWAALVADCNVQFKCWGWPLQLYMEWCHVIWGSTSPQLLLP